MKLINIKKQRNHRIISFLGIKFKIKIKSKKTNFFYDTSIISENNLCVFFIPGNYVNGGIMSIFTLCKHSRIVCSEYKFIISTMPGREVFSEYSLFKNDEIIYNWEQIIKNISPDHKIIFHLPENYVNAFVKSLSDSEKDYLSKCNLQINIMNQNIKYMPDKDIIRKLYALTSNITQTTAFSKYVSQKMCDKYGIPLYHFSTYLDISPYAAFLENKKEKTIIFSPDAHPYKDKIRAKIRKELPEYNVVEPQKLSFYKYWEKVSKASYVITFGEGFDGYFNISPRFNTMSFSVYNDDFFPNIEWKNLRNCYSSYDEMFENIVKDIKTYDSNRELYKNIVSEHEAKRSSLYSLDKYQNNLRQFYNANPLFLPKSILDRRNLISVIVTTYNHARYIECALDSVLGQVCSADVEVLVGNDCSTDNTEEILKKYAACSNVQIFNRKSNLGAQANLRDLLELCRGDYIAILEGDDYWISEKYLQKQLDVLQDQEQALMSFTNFYILINGQRRVNTTSAYKSFMGPRYSLLYCRPSNFSCCMYRRKAIQYIPESYWHCPRNFCAFFNFYVLDNGAACYIHEPLMVYRCHETSVWSSMTAKKQVLQAVDSLYRLSIEIPDKYDDIILYVMNNLTTAFKDSFVRKSKIKNIFSIDLPVSKKKKFSFKVQKMKKIE